MLSRLRVCSIQGLRSFRPEIPASGQEPLCDDAAHQDSNTPLVTRRCCRRQRALPPRCESTASSFPRQVSHCRCSLLPSARSAFPAFPAFSWRKKKKPQGDKNTAIKEQLKAGAGAGAGGCYCCCCYCGQRSEVRGQLQK